jgi:hypothetical protein
MFRSIDAALSAINARTFVEAAQVLGAGWFDVSRRVIIPNALTDTIELITFFGPITRLDVLLHGDADPVMVDLASNEARDLAPGLPVVLSIPPNAIPLYT